MVVALSIVALSPMVDGREEGGCALGATLKGEGVH